MNFTADLRKQGWNQPHEARKVSYLRRPDALRPRWTAGMSKPANVTTVQFLLIGKPLPRVEDSIRIGELLRLAVMSRAKVLLGEDAIPSVFSGHDLPADNRHQHAFYLPWDADGDGRIDRLVLHVPAALDTVQRGIVESLRRIWDRDGSEWRLVLEAIGGSSVSSLLSASRQWRSVTPYLHPWHRKKGFDVEEQIRRECRARGWPEPVEIERIESVDVGSRPRRPIHFRRLRSRRSVQQPDRNGSFWRLCFPEPLAGPLALGFGCHFGLGLFEALEPLDLG